VDGKDFSLFGQSVFHLLETLGKPSICAIKASLSVAVASLRSPAPSA